MGVPGAPFLALLARSGLSMFIVTETGEFAT